MTAVGYQETAICESMQQDTNQQTKQSQRFPEIQDRAKNPITVCSTVPCGILTYNLY